MSTVTFFHQDGIYGEFSNFYKAEVNVFGMKWKSSEHAFQALKYTDLVPGRNAMVNILPDALPHFTKVRFAETCYSCKKLGCDRSVPIRKDWDNEIESEIPVVKRVKDLVMYHILVAKFTQNENLKKVLLDTGDKILVENSPYDYYWGCGKNETGENRLGKLLMHLRNKLRE